MQVSVIVSTYNQPEWLEKVLWGYNIQSFKEFELIVADDGAGKATREVLERLTPQLSYPLKHVWHEDRGFRKCEILNKAILAASTDYLVFTDGDCIPRNDFIEKHMKFRKKGYFLSGGYHKLSMDTSREIRSRDIKSQACFNIRWLKQHGMRNSFRNNKLTRSSFKAFLLNFLTTTRATWNGCNASGWLEDIIRVNGFDERMEYGGQDREFGERLVNAGIRGLQIRYSAICLHLDHARGYVNESALRKNKKIRKDTVCLKHVRTNFGIVKSEDSIC